MGERWDEQDELTSAAEAFREVDEFLGGVRRLERQQYVAAWWVRFAGQGHHPRGDVHAEDRGLQGVQAGGDIAGAAEEGPFQFPSTVVHTLPLALAVTEVKVAVCDIDLTWLTAHASPRAQGFLSGVTGSDRDATRLAAVTVA